MKCIAVFSILILGLLSRLMFLDYPNQVVFDEVHFGSFISSYEKGEFFFDIHPPLGKLLIFGFGSLAGVTDSANYSNIGNTYPDTSYIWLRFLPALIGGLIPLLGYFIARALRLTIKASWLIGLLLVLESSLITQSRYILIDPFLLFFGFAGVLTYLKARASGSFVRSWGWWLASAVLVSGALSVKWTGVSFVGLILFYELIMLLRARIKHWRWFLGICAMYAVTAVVVYTSVFAVHFALLPKKGTGNAYFNETFATASFSEKFQRLNREMYESNKRLGGHSYASSWYSWPLMFRPIYYWYHSLGETAARIYLFGNIVVYAAAAISIISLVVFGLFKRIQPQLRNSALFIVLGYIFNLLPFVLITRPMFLYHYFTALIFAIFALGLIYDHISYRRKAIFAILVVSALATFVYFAPVVYGVPLTSEQFDDRVWIESWR